MHVSGYFILAALIAGILAVIRLVHHFSWTSSPTMQQYLAAHPDCAKPEGAVCSVCGTKPARQNATGRRSLYRCPSCETDLYRGV